VAENLIAVFDAGKTHAKVTLVGSNAGAIGHAVETLKSLLAGPVLR